MLEKRFQSVSLEYFCFLKQSYKNSLLPQLGARVYIKKERKKERKKIKGKQNK